MSRVPIPVFTRVELPIYAGSKGATSRILKKLAAQSGPAHLWYSPAEGTVRVGNEERDASRGEVLVGVYDRNVMVTELRDDLAFVRKQF